MVEQHTQGQPTFFIGESSKVKMTTKTLAMIIGATVVAATTYFAITGKLSSMDKDIAQVQARLTAVEARAEQLMLRAASSK